MFAFKCLGCGADLWSASSAHERLACPVCNGALEPKETGDRTREGGNVIPLPSQTSRGRLR